MATAQPHQGLGLRQPVGVLEQPGQVVEASGDVGMVLAETLLGNSQRSPHQGLGLRQPVGVLQQLGQVVEVFWRRSDGPCQNSARQWPPPAVSRARPPCEGLSHGAKGQAGPSALQLAEQCRLDRPQPRQTLRVGARDSSAARSGHRWDLRVAPHPAARETV